MFQFKNILLDMTENIDVMSKRIQPQKISQLRLNLTSPKSLAILKEIDDNESNNSNDTENDFVDQLFHTICNGTSANAFSFAEGKHNVLWFLLEESILDLCEKNQSSDFSLKEGIVRETHDIIRTLTISSDNERLLFLRFKTSLLPKVMCKLYSGLDDNDFVIILSEIWDRFWFNILPSIECLLYEIEILTNDSIRNASIISFRDHFLLNGKFEESLKNLEFRNSQSIKHMALVVQNVQESIPQPRKHLEMERLTAQLFSEYFGYSGFYSEGKLTFKARQDHVQERGHPFQATSSSPLDLTLTPKYRTRTKLQRKISFQPQTDGLHFNNIKYLKFMSKLYK